MNKKNARLLILLLVLVACIAGYLGITAYNNHAAAQKSAADEAAKVHLNSLGQITQLSFTNSSGEFSFRLDNDLWYDSSDADFPLKQSKLQDIVGTLSTLTAVRSFEPGDSLSAYGLDKPAYTLTAADTDGSTLTLLIGGKTGDNYYVTNQNGTMIYTISSTLASALDCTQNDLVQLETFPSLGEDTLNSIAIASQTDTLTLEKEAVVLDSEPAAQSGDSAAESPAEPQTSVKYVWYLLSEDGSRTAVDSLTPATGDNPTDLMDKLTGAVSFLTFKSCVNYRPDAQSLSQYGLDAPSLTLTVSYTNTDGDGNQTSGSFTLSTGTLNADSSGYYAVKDGSAAVNLIAAETVSTLSNTLSAFHS